MKAYVLTWLLALSCIAGGLIALILRHAPSIPPTPPPYDWDYVIPIAPPGTGRHFVRVNHRLPTPNRIVAALSSAFDENSLGHGKARANWDKEMKVGLPYVVTLRVAKSDLADFEEGMKGSVTKRIDVIISARMRAVLLGDSTVDISGGEPAIQIVDGGTTYTQWAWSAVPKSLGPHRLTVTLACVITGDHIPETSKNSYSDFLDVEVKPNWRRTRDQFMETKLPDLLSLLIVAAVSAIVSAIVAFFGGRMRAWHKKTRARRGTGRSFRK